MTLPYGKLNLTLSLAATGSKFAPLTVTGNKFYARLRRSTDPTPSEVRAMPSMEFEHWLDDRIPLRWQLAERRRLSRPAPAGLAAERRLTGS